MPDIRDPNDPRHGTLTGYRAHLRAGSETCAACRQARNEHERANYVKRRGACRQCGQQCRSVIGICHRCQRANQGMKPCESCGRTTKADDKVCGVCRRYELKESDLLLDGWWAPVRSESGHVIQKWVPAA